MNAADGCCIFPAYRDPDGGWLIYDTRHDLVMLGLLDNNMTNEEKEKDEARIVELNRRIKDQEDKLKEKKKEEVVMM